VIALTGLIFLGTPPANGQQDADQRQGDTTIDLLGIQKQFEQIADRVSPSVVAVSASEVQDAANQIPPPDQMTPEKLRAELNRGVRTVGTGFVVDSDGYILTNDHVIANAQQLWITSDAGRVYPAMLVATDPMSDLAILKTPAVNLPPVQFAVREPIRRGMWSIALGNPYGLATDGDMALAAGVVSAVNRSLSKLSQEDHRLYDGLIQTTAQINPGNSGGPLVDINGNVIGINVAVILPDKQTNGIGFAIPADVRTLRVIDELKEGKPITHGFLGVSLTTPSPAERRQAGAPDDVGVEVVQIFPDSPASRSALAAGDIIASFDGQMMHSTQQLAQIVADAPLRQPSRLIVFRNGQIISVAVKLSARPADQLADQTPANRLHWDGMLLAPLPANWMQSGVMVLALDSNSPVASLGIHPGSIITSVAGKLVSNLEQFQQIITATPIDQCAFQTVPGSERVAAASGK
jgi:S1-C subfamily serine protease